MPSTFWGSNTFSRDSMQDGNARGSTPLGDPVVAFEETVETSEVGDRSLADESAADEPSLEGEQGRGVGPGFLERGRSLVKVVKGKLFSVADRITGLSPEHDKMTLPMPTQILTNENALPADLFGVDPMGGAIYLETGRTGFSPILLGLGETVDVCTSTPSMTMTGPGFPQKFFLTQVTQENPKEQRRGTKQRGRSQEITPPDILKARSQVNDPKRLRLEEGNNDGMDADGDNAPNSED
jgi:hypothetical protein